MAAIKVFDLNFELSIPKMPIQHKLNGEQFDGTPGREQNYDIPK